MVSLDSRLENADLFIDGRAKAFLDRLFKIDYFTPVEHAEKDYKTVADH